MTGQVFNLPYFPNKPFPGLRQWKRGAAPSFPRGFQRGRRHGSRLLAGRRSTQHGIRARWATELPACCNCGRRAVSALTLRWLAGRPNKETFQTLRRSLPMRLFGRSPCGSPWVRRVAIGAFSFLVSFRAGYRSAHHHRRCGWNPAALDPCHQGRRS